MCYYVNFETVKAKTFPKFIFVLKYVQTSENSTISNSAYKKTRDGL